MGTGVAQGTGSPLPTIARDPLLRRAGTALALYRIAEFGPWVAMLVFAYANGGATAAGVVSLALLAPAAIFAPFAGALIDRYGASGTLVGAYTVQASAMGATAVSLLVGAPPIVSYVLGAMTATVLTVTHSAHAVMSPGIARTTEQLVALNAITGWILSIGLIVAPAVAGLMLEFSTPGAVYALGACLLAGAAVLVFPLRGLVPPLARPEKDRRRPAPIRELGQAARGLAGEAAAREVLLVVAATYLMVGAFDVLAVVLAIGELGLGGSGAGYLTALHGAGAVIGAVTSFALIGRARIMPFLLTAAFLSGAGFVVLGIATLLPVALVVGAVAGISRSLLEVSAATLLQRATPTVLLARVFAFKAGLSMAAWGLGSIMVPGLIALGGVKLALIGTGAIVPVIVLSRFSRLLQIDAVATVPVVAISLLRSMRIFRALPVPALEGIARGAIEVSVARGAPIVEQGEPGDRYYAIADGTVEVTIDGRVVGTLDRGEGFGEIALLHEAPRTASVTAKTDASLLAIEREPFLVALVGHAESETRLTAIVEERLPRGLKPPLR